MDARIHGLIPLFVLVVIVTLDVRRQRGSAEAVEDLAEGLERCPGELDQGKTFITGHDEGLDRAVLITSRQHGSRLHPFASDHAAPPMRRGTRKRFRVRATLFGFEQEHLHGTARLLLQMQACRYHAGVVHDEQASRWEQLGQVAHHAMVDARRLLRCQEQTRGVALWERTRRNTLRRKGIIKFVDT